MKDEQTKREKRRRRRVRNQIFAYLTLAVLAVAAIAALYFGANGAVRYLKKYNERVSEVIAEAESEAAAELETAQAQSGQQEEETESEGEGYRSELSDDPLGELVDTLLQDMTIEEMVAGMFIITPEQLTGVQTVVQAGDATKAALAENPVGGLVYTAKNFKSADQFTQMLSNVSGYSKYPLFLAVSAECGDGEAFSVADTPKAAELTSADSVTEAYATVAETLASYGVNLDLAPVSEVVSEDGDASLQGRTFGSDAATAAPLVSAAVQALQELGVSASLQKFPGTGTGSKTLEELKNSEFLIYEAAIRDGVDCITVSNTASKGVTGSDTPDSLSETIITQTLRESLGFDGVVMTDALDDTAITQSYTAAEAAVAAVVAGADVLYRPADYAEAYEGVLQAVADGTITGERIYESVYRIYRVKYKDAVLK